MSAIDTRNWMGRLESKIGHLKPWEVVLPASHNAGAFSSDMTVWGRNQQDDIRSQLEGGVRALDLRVTEQFCGLYLHHSGLASMRQSLGEALRQIADFVTRHPREIVVVSLDTGYGSNLTTDDDKQNLRRFVVEMLEERMAAVDPHGTHSSLQTLADHGRNVLVVQQFSGGTGIGDRLFWPSYWLRSTWGTYQSDPLASLPQKLQWLKPHVAAGLQSGHGELLWADCAVWSANILEGAAAKVNPAVARWLQEWAENGATRAGLNLIAVDNVHADDFLIVRTLLGLYERGLLPAHRGAAGGEAAADAERPGLASIGRSGVTSESLTFSEANAQQVVTDAGLDWRRLKLEFGRLRYLSGDTLRELEAHGVPLRFVEAFFTHTAVTRGW